MNLKSVKNFTRCRNLLPVFFYLISLSAMAQFNLKGHVSDAATDLPINTFTVTADSVTTSFNNGEFQLQVKAFPVQLTIRSGAYATAKLIIRSEQSRMTVQLIPEGLSIPEVQVKAFRSDKRLFDTPGMLNLITNRQLSREPSFTLAPSLNKVPGLWMQSGTMNTNRLSIRGIGTRSPYGTNKIRAYYGDIPLTNGVGETVLEDLDLEQISTIEVIKGPASAFYGSGLGGVLLFHPSNPSQNQFSQSVSLGSFQTVKYSGKLALAADNSGHILAYSRIHSAGYRENNTIEKHNISLISNFHRKNTRVDFLVAFVWTDAYIPSSVDLKTYLETPEKAASNWALTKGYENYSKAMAGVSVQQNLGNDWKMKVGTFAQFNRNNELRPFNILQETNLSWGFRSVLEKQIGTPRSNMRFFLGNEYFGENYKWQTLRNNNRVAGDLISDNQENRSYNNIFLMTDLRLTDQFLFTANLNVNQTSYNYVDQFLNNGDQSASYSFRPVISPRLSAMWYTTSNLRIFSILSHGFSVPTLEETLLPNGERNSSIKPETGWNFEIGAKSSFGNTLSAEFSLYYMKVRNLLVARRTDEDAYIGLNAGETNHVGLEFSIDYRLVNRLAWNSYLRMNANLTNYRFAEFLDQGTNYSGNRLTGTPNSITNWMLETTHKTGFFLNMNLQTVGRMPMRDDNSIFTEAYQLVNVMSGYEKSFNRLIVNVSCGFQNLNDTRYASMILINASSSGTQSPRYYYPGLPRNYKSVVSLKYSF